MRVWRFRRRGFRPEAGGVADSVVGEGVEGDGDAAGAEVSEGGSADEVVLVGVLRAVLGDVKGDFGLETGFHVGREVFSVAGEAVLGGISGGDAAAVGGFGAF